MKDLAVSPVLGFVLVLAIIVAGIGVIQTMFVPTWIKSVEAKHYFSLKSEFEELVEKAVDASNGGMSVVSFDLTLNYPKYPFLLTPNTASSTIVVKKIGRVSINSSLLSQPIVLDLLAVEFEPNYYHLDANKEIMILGDYFTESGQVLGESILGGSEINLIVINISEGTYSGKERIVLYGNPPFTLSSADVTIELSPDACAQYGWYLDFVGDKFSVTPSNCKITVSGKLNLFASSTDKNWSGNFAEKLVNSTFTISNESFATWLSSDPSNPTIIDLPLLTLFGTPTFYVSGYTGYNNQPVNVTLDWKLYIFNIEVDSLLQNFVWYTLSNGYFQLSISPPFQSANLGVVMLNITLQFPDNSTKTFYVRFE